MLSNPKVPRDKTPKEVPSPKWKLGSRENTDLQRGQARAPVFTPSPELPLLALLVSLAVTKTLSGQLNLLTLHSEIRGGWLPSRDASSF